MSLVAALALAASTATLPSCSWDRPGVNPFMGDVVAAVDRYQDIPAATRAKLKTRMQKRQYDEMVEIRRDAILGKGSYRSEIRDMHFGAGSVCRTVTRSKWTDQTTERGLVYCEDGQCILVPTVCRNVSRIERAPARAAAAEPPLAKAPEEMPLEFEPPAAGAPEGALGGGAPSTPPGSFSDLSTNAPVIPGGTTTPTTPGGGFTPLPGGNGDPGVIPLPPTPVPPPVPEPGTWAMFALGLGALGLLGRRRARKA